MHDWSEKKKNIKIVRLLGKLFKLLFIIDLFLHRYNITHTKIIYIYCTKINAAVAQLMYENIQSYLCIYYVYYLYICVCLNYGKIMRCALFEILYLTEVYLVTD